MSREVMYAVVALSLALVVLLMFLRTREHLQMNDKVKLVTSGGKYDKEQAKRIMSMAPADMQQAFIDYAKKNPQNPFGRQPPEVTTPEEQAAYGISTITDYAVAKIYEPAKTPITPDDIDRFLSGFVAELDPIAQQTYIQQHQNGNLRKLLISYFIQEQPAATTPATTPTPATVATPAVEGSEERLVLTDSSDFGQAVEIFKHNYIQYRTTGKTFYKEAYENAQRWIEKYLAGLNENIEKSSDDITDFVNKYASSGSDIGNLGASLREIRRDGPALQNKYETVKRIQAEESKVDYTDYYVKGAIAAALLGVGVVVSLL